MNEQDLKEVVINPFYAINIYPGLAAEHEPLITKEKWVKANENLIKEIGIEEWLKTLLDVLESGGPKSPESE